MADDTDVPTIRAPKTPIKTPGPANQPGKKDTYNPTSKPKPREFDDPDGERIPTAAEVRARMGFKKGGSVEGKKSDEAQDKKMIATMIHKHEKRDHPGKALTKFKGGGSVSKRADGIAQRGKTRGKMV